MKKVFLLTVIFMFDAGLGFCTSTSGAYNLQKIFNEIADRAKPAVVNISVVSEQSFRVIEPEFFFFGIPENAPVYKYRMQGMGSGVIVDPKGYIVTNAHVVRGADEIKVIRYIPGKKEVSYTGKVVGLDDYYDIALIKIITKEKLPFLKFADLKTVKTGDWAIAIGSPFGLSQTTTVGIVFDVIRNGIPVYVSVQVN